MTPRRLSRAACVIALAFLAGSITLRILAQTAGGHPEIASPLSTAVEAAAISSFTLVGVVLVARRPENPIGWLMLLPLDFANAYAEYTLLAHPDSPLPGGEIAAAADTATWTPFVASVLLLLLLFPGGRFPSTRWRVIGWYVAVGAAVSFVSSLLKYRELDGPYVGLENPLAVLSSFATYDLTGYLVVLPAMLLVPVAAFDLISRFRRSRGEERQQFRWLAFSGAVVVGYFPVYLALGSVADELGYMLFTLTLMSLPISIGVAVLKYRLYEIDRLVSRTLVYSALTAILATTYVGLVAGLQALLRPVSGGTDLAIVVTTLIVAALFLPARRRVQDAVDRRFNRRAYDAARTVDAFSARLRQQIDLDTLRYELLAVVDETMQPERSSLWLRSRNDPGTP
jgi:hypothetical protein